MKTRKHLYPSVSSCLSEATLDEDVEATETEKANMQDDDCMGGAEPKEVPKDRLHTTESGDIVRRLPYKIPRKQR